MSSWEERMAQRSQVRHERARLDAEAEAEDHAEQKQCRDAYEAGPPCTECYSWVRSRPAFLMVGTQPMPFPGEEAPRWQWVHDMVDTEDGWCRHECHGPGGEYHPVVAMA